MALISIILDMNDQIEKEITSIISSSNFKNKVYVGYGFTIGKSVIPLVSNTYQVLPECVIYNRIKQIKTNFERNLLPNIIFHYVFIESPTEQQFSSLYEYIQQGGYIFIGGTLSWETESLHTPSQVTESGVRIFIKNSGVQSVGLVGDSTTPPTVVTSLYDVGNHVASDKILSYTQNWLKLTIPIIIWTDSVYYQRLSDLFIGKKNVVVKCQNLSEFIPYKYREILYYLYNTYHVNNRSQSKDTLMYHMLMFCRPYMWRSSLIDNPFNSQSFMFLDYGLPRFTTDFNVIETWKITDKIRVLTINPYLPTDPEPFQYFHTILHNVAGGLMTGTTASMLKYTELFDVEFRLMISDRWCQLDEALLSSIVRKYPELFDCYYGDYCGIIANYSKICDLTNIDQIITKYLNNFRYAEAQHLLNQIDRNKNQSLMSLYCDYSILTNFYSLDKFLSPVVRMVLESPEYKGITGGLMWKHGGNIKCY